MAISPGLSEIVTTTLRNRTGKLADNVTKNNALLMRLREKGNVRPFDGGRTIVEELEYQENTNFRRYTGYDTLATEAQDTFTAAEFNIKQAAVTVQINGLEQLQNSGKEQVIPLLEKRIDNGEKTMMNNIALDCYSNGSAYQQIGGLQLLVADTPTNTVGGINRNTWTFYRNQSFGFAANSLVPSAATIQTAMNRLWLSTSRGRDHPDLIVADNTYFRYYWESLQAIQRIASDSEATAGFTSLKYMNADVVFDGGFGGGAPASKMYFLNTDYIYFRPHKNRNFVPLDTIGAPVNQDAIVKVIAFAGNMTLSNGFLQGVLIA